MSKLGVGVIGVGEMGKRHAENLARLVPKARLVGVADTNLERARSAAQELEVEHYYDNAEALAARQDVQAVVIATPAKFHAPAIQVAARAGKHIFCEKPLALTMEEADTALEAVRQAGVSLQLGFMRHYDPAYAQAKKSIEAGEIGDPIIFKSIGRDTEAPPLAYFESGWNGTLFHDNTVHDFDLARWLMADEVTEVHTYAAARALPQLTRLGLFDSGVVNLRFAHGAIGNVESFLDARYGYDVRTEVVGTKGTIQVGSLRDTPVQVLAHSECRHRTVNHFLVRFADAYVLEMRDFVETILSDRMPGVTGLDGRQALAVVLAAVTSFRETRPVPVAAPVRPAAPERT
ncbi:MAG: Gfo/Idh/MocA family oxidoreductase [Terriglobia bacterium]|jgi:scyllo-inositol 2-dehydrogenase (NAD+)